MTLDYKDEILTECLNDIISGLLPHDVYNSETFVMLYPALKSIIPTDDTRGLYFAFFTIFDKYMALSAAVPAGTFKISISKERFSSALANNLPDLILEPKMDIVTLMAEEGKSADISLPSVQQEVMGVLYQKAMALYENCFDRQKSYDDSMSKLVDLKDVIKANLIESGLSAQRVIMSTGLRIGRNFYSGPAGWVEYTQNLAREIRELDSSKDNDLECKGLDLVNGLDAHNEELLSPLANYGIDLLDDFTPMLRHRLVVMVAKENTGKTQVCIHLIAKLIRAGVKPFYACGESPKGLMFNCIVSSYIYQEYGMFFETQYLSGEGYESLCPEDKQVVNTAKARIACSGLVISDNLTYDAVPSKVQYYYNRGCEAFFIDHTQSLRGRNGRKIGDLVTGLALDCRELKNTLPIYICLTSQPSTGLKDLLQKDQTKDLQLSPTAQSAAPSQEADELFILTETDYLKSQGLLAWITNKRRNAIKPKTFYILKHFNVSAFEYDAKYQGVDSVDTGTLDALVNDIAGYTDDEEDGDEIPMDF